MYRIMLTAFLVVTMNAYAMHQGGRIVNKTQYFATVHFPDGSSTHLAPISPATNYTPLVPLNVFLLIDYYGQYGWRREQVTSTAERNRIEISPQGVTLESDQTAAPAKSQQADSSLRHPVIDQLLANYDPKKALEERRKYAARRNGQQDWE